jgi:P22 coat protein - gene protein 5
MANTMLTAAIIAREALMILENNLVIADKVYRGYESEFDKNINGYKIGDTVTIRKPAQYVLRTGPIMAAQDTTEGSTSVTINQQVGVDFSFTSTDLTLKIGDLAERVIEPAMVRLADKVDVDLFGLFPNVNNWVGTPGNTLSNFDSFAAGTERLNNGAVPLEDRTAVLTPRDKRGMLAAIAGPASIFNEKAVGEAYRRGILGTIDGVETYGVQNVATLTTGTRTNGTNNSGVPTTYAASKDTGTQTLTISGLGAGGTISAGEVFTLAGVFDVNPVNKQTQSFLKQFTVTTAATADGGGLATVTIRPAMILTGAYQNISAAPAAGAVLTWMGAASTNFRQNMIFHRNAFALVMVPMIRPEGAVKVSRMSHKGISVRVIPVYDGTNDNNAWRLDVLYGVKVIDERLAVRLSGT